MNEHGVQRFEMLTEKRVLEKVSSENEKHRTSLKRMISITNASEDICRSILEEQGYDLESSVNVYIND